MRLKLKSNKLVAEVFILSFLFIACSKVQETESLSSKSVLNRTNHTVAGIGSGPTGFDLLDTRDQVVPFDYYGMGKASQLIGYRPGNGLAWIYTNIAPVGSTPAFSRVFATSSGIGASPNNYDLRDSRDRIIPYDMDGTGIQSYIICFRPGARLFYIFKNAGGVFTNILKSGSGIGPFDLAESRDKVVPYDFYGTGHATELLCYRPGTGMCWVLKNTAATGATPNFVQIYSTTTGIGLTNDSYRFDLADSRDLIVPWDIDGSGLQTGLVCYRPGTGVTFVIKRLNDPMYPNDPFEVRSLTSTGVWGDVDYHFDLKNNADRIIPFDRYSNGSTSNALCYRPGYRTCAIFDSYPTLGTQPVLGNGWWSYTSNTQGIGSGTTYYDLANSNDKIIAYDLNGTGKLDHLVCYRPGSGFFWILNNSLVKVN